MSKCYSPIPIKRYFGLIRQVTFHKLIKERCRQLVKQLIKKMLKQRVENFS